MVVSEIPLKLADIVRRIYSWNPDFLFKEIVKSISIGNIEVGYILFIINLPDFYRSNISTRKR